MSAPEKQKTLILCAPSDFGFFDCIKVHLEKSGFEVFGFPIEDANYKYKSILNRIYNSYRKIILGDKHYKTTVKLKERYQSLSPKLERLQNVDFALFIRPDMYPQQFIQEVKNKATKTVAYQWDSFNRFPHVLNYINLFDHFFTYDFRDLTYGSSLKLITNFYIGEPEVCANTERKTAYLLGSFDEDRFQQAVALKKELEYYEFDCSFTLKTAKKDHIKRLTKSGLKSITRSIYYPENLAAVKESTLLIDVQNTSQVGLSFRVFESLCYGKKTYHDK